jgi:ComEC/Rec2-related protein
MGLAVRVSLSLLRRMDLMRYHPRLPLIGLAFSFVAGTWIGLSYHANLLFLAAATLILLSIALWFAIHRRLPVAGMFCIHGLAFLTAWINADLHTWHKFTPSLDSMNDMGGFRIELVGIVTDEPVNVITDKSPTWRFPLQVEQIRKAGQVSWQNVEGQVRITWYDDGHTRFPRYGDRWVISGRLRAIERKPAEKRARHRLLFLSTGPRNAEFHSAGHGSSAIQYCLQSRTWARRLLTAGIEHHTNDVAVLNSLLLGYRSQMPQEIYRSYARTGTLHIFAISGSHVVVLAAVIVFVLGTFKIQRTRWVLFVGPLLVFYTIMTGLQPSAVRACIMAVIFLLAPLLDRKSGISSALALSAVLILAVVPADLLDIGFILSYVAMLGLILLYPIFSRSLQRLFRPDPLRLQPESPTLRALRIIWRETTLLVATSFAAWLVSTPLTAYYFQLFSPIALIGNLIAIPLASLIIVTGSLSLVTGSCVAVLGEVFNHANLVLASWLTASMKFFASIPCAYFEAPPPPLWVLSAFYLSLAAWVLEHRRKEPSSPKLSPPKD